MSPFNSPIVHWFEYCYNSVMDKITLKNFRCFREEQTAQLAPLTLLVGENSTGKTSFMALIRALWDVAFREEAPDFRETPFNLGSFKEIVHNRGGRGDQAPNIEVCFESGNSIPGASLSFQTTFEERFASPFPAVRRIDIDGTWVEVVSRENEQHGIRCGDRRRENYPTVERDVPFLKGSKRLYSLAGAAAAYTSEVPNRDKTDWLGGLINTLSLHLHRGPYEGRPFASGPVRSRPLRTYDPSRPWPDPEGEYVPTFLASIYHRDPDGWQLLKGKLEEFGQASGLFDEISVKSFGKTEGTPFQLEIRKFANNGRRKGPQRNLIDVGYGVSQALPLLTELLKAEASQMFLLQQPEVHLHPRAQAALGSLFCQLAGTWNQLIVETHSDYLIDRVRMDIRDKKTDLKPEDVSILYFEHGDLDVKIHSIRLDKMGNVLDAPPSYRKFFMEEVSRSIGIGL